MLEGPLASTDTSRPFRSAHVRTSILYVDLDLLGYTEEEYVLRGTADARDPEGNVIAAGEAYVTRVLVRRPADDARFSGTVHLEPFHVLNEDTPISLSGAKSSSALSMTRVASEKGVFLLPMMLMYLLKSLTFSNARESIACFLAGLMSAFWAIERLTTQRPTDKADKNL